MSEVRPLPTWFVVGLTASVVWCATAGSLGIYLLIRGWYSAGPLGAVSTLAAGAAGFAAWRGLGHRENADHRAAFAAMALVVAFLALAGAFHSEHLLSDRDPALYITNGRFIARTQELKPKTHLGAYKAREFGSPEARYAPNFFPMLPVLLALGWSVGGDSGLLLVPPLLGALGLLTCYALAARVLGPRAGLIVPAFLALGPLQLWFARDAYSELVVQIVVLGGLWLYLEARARTRWGIGLVSGFVVASSALARIDALGLVACALVVAAAAWVACASDATPARARRVVLAFFIALVVGTLIALNMSNKVAFAYIHSLKTEYDQLLTAFRAGIAGFVVVVVAQRVRPGLGRWLAKQKYLFVGAVAVAAGVVTWAYVWRPHPKSELPVFTSMKQITAPLRKIFTDWHFSRSLHWFSAYFGVVAIVVAFVGFVILASWSRRGNGAAAAVFLVAVPMAVLYVARPSITPDLPWAMRRYLPVVIPGIAIALAVAVTAAWRAARSLNRPVPRIAAGVGVMAVVLSVAVPTAQAAIPFVHARAQHGALAAVHDICKTAGDDSALLVYGPGFIYIELPQPLLVFCGVPTARSSKVDLLQLAKQWRTFGRRLVVATAAPDMVKQNAKGAKVIGHFVISDDDEPERVFERSSRRFKPSPREIWLLEIPAA